jgi:hypothetical protein
MSTTKIPDELLSSGVGTGASKLLKLDSSGKLPAVDGSNLTGMAIPTLDSPSITGTLSVDNGGTVSHTVSNWSDDITYVITPTNCTVGAVNTSGIFVITHTTGSPSYTIKATTDSLGLDDSSLVTKNLLMNLSAPTLSSPADSQTLTNVIYTITSTDTNDDKLILDIGSSNFTYSSVSVGTASKVGNTVECIGFTTNNPAVTIQFTVQATYSVTAKSINIAGTYGDSASSSADSLTISNAYDVDFLIVAGGGGARTGQYHGGGGGAGGYRNSYNSEASGGGGSSEAALAIAIGTQYTVTVGNGGATGSSGSDSVFSTITSIGGGMGGPNPNTGGSGGGGGEPGTGAAGTSNQGYAGGTSGGTGAHGSGGGGAGAVGASATNNTYSGGNGGVGLASSITGSSVTRGGGGGGGGYAPYGGTGGSGGSGGGGNGGGSNHSASAGTANTGGGGGGVDQRVGTSQAGGSGVIILRMLTSDYSGTTTGSPTVTTSGSNTILTFNGSGSYTG